MSASLASPEAVDVWELSLSVSDDRLPAERALLSDEEKRRADRFIDRPARRRFIVTRAALRRLLGEYCGQDPASIHIAAEPYGKPYSPELPLQFNVSHSDELALIALASKRVGIDVERIRPVRDALELAERFFAAPERAGLWRAAQGALDEAFLRCWTLKEALLKARGSGFQQPLESVAVDFDAEPPGYAWVAGTPEGEPEWRLSRLPVAEGYIAALAIDGDLGTVRRRVYQP